MPNPSQQDQAKLMKAYHLRNEGKIDASLKIAKSLVKIHPSHPHILYLMGTLYLEKNKYTLAEKNFLAGIKFDPKGHMNQGGLGGLYVKKAEYEKALEHLLLASQRSPNEYAHLKNIGLTYASLSNIEMAIKYYKICYDLDPKDSEVGMSLAHIYEKTEEIRPAFEIMIRLVRLYPDDLDILKRIADLYVNRSLIDEAKGYYEILLTKDPDNFSAGFSVFNIDIQQGNTDTALERLISLAQKFPSEYITLFSFALKMKKVEEVFGAEQEQIKEKILEDSVNEVHLKNLTYGHLYSLSLILEHFEQYDDAFAILTRANEEKKKLNKCFNLAFDRQPFIDYVKAINEFDDWENLTKEVPTDDRHMVFILAMPRSGTTLLEQIISAHPKADGIGESYNLNKLKEFLAGEIIKHIPILNCLQLYQSLDLSVKKTLAATFLKSAALDLTDKTAERIVEKSIENFLYVGLLAALFPNAKFIYCQRDRAASGLSIYQQDFTNLFMYDNDLEDINFMFDVMEDLMKVWNSQFGNRILTIRYEDLVENPEENARAIINHIELDWDPACLAFHQKKRVIKTASLFQARSPVFKSSANRYMKYEKHLTALIK